MKFPFTLSLPMLVAAAILLASANFRNESGTKEEVQIFCFYELDDKYSETEDLLMVRRWLFDKSKQILAGNVSGNVFDLKGGGPNGAQWNPSTNLFLAASGCKYKPINLLINGEKQKLVPFLFGELVWFRIPYTNWINQLHPITPGVENELFRNDNDKDSDTQTPNFIEGAGETLKLSVQHGGEIVSRYFYAAFGE